MEAIAHNQMWDTRLCPNRLNFALVIEEADNLRHSVLARLREHGWLAHGVNRAEQALSMLVHIPYNLIVLDSELPGIGAMDFARILRKSKDWRAIGLVIISGSEDASCADQIAETGAFLARRSTWEEDLFGFLLSRGEAFRMNSACGPIL